MLYQTELHLPKLVAGFEPTTICSRSNPISHCHLSYWLRGRDLHPQPSAYEADKLLLLYPSMRDGEKRRGCVFYS